MYGLFHLEDTLKKAEGRAFKLFFRKFTNTKLKAIGSGVFITGILQSSSIVNLLVLSFTGAGMLSMRNAMGVVLGANIGGTFNSWLMAIVGFKADLGTLTLPFIAISGIGLMVLKPESKVYRLLRFTMGAGLLLLGLDFMKESMAGLIKEVDLTAFLKYPSIVFLLIGFGITALIQTSAATVVIVLTALYSKIIPIETGIAVVLGAELGTTLKVTIGAIGGIEAIKRVALGNTIFNVTTSALGFVLMAPIIALLGKMGLHDPLFTLVAFQTFINIAGVIVFSLFLNAYGNFLENRFKEDTTTATLFIQNTSPVLTETAIEMLEKEVGLFLYRVMHLNLEVFHSPDQPHPEPINAEFFKPKYQLNQALSYHERYQILKHAEGEIFLFYSKMLGEQIEQNGFKRLTMLMASVRRAMYAAKGMKDISHDKQEFSNSANDLKYNLYKNFQTQLNNFYKDIFEVFELKDPVKQYDRLELLMDVIKLDYESNMHSSYKNAGTQVLKEVDISTLFNINRELYASCEAILLGVKDFLLRPEAAERFEEKPVFKVK
jgi:phosphate:Na+ symporter